MDATARPGDRPVLRRLNQLDVEALLAYQRCLRHDTRLIGGDEAEEGEEPLMVDEDRVDITQLLVDEAGLTLPFNPVRGLRPRVQ